MSIFGNQAGSAVSDVSEAAEGESGGGIALVLGAFADLGGKVDKMSSRLKMMGESRPIYFRYITSYPGAAAPPQPVVLAIPEAPSPGHMWYVQRVGVFGSDGHTAVPGVLADIFTGPGEQGSVTPGQPLHNYTDQIYTGLTVPSIVEEGRFHNPMEPNDQVYASVFGVPANQQIVLAILVADYRIDQQEAMTQ